MYRPLRLWILAALTVTAILIVFSIKSIPQNAAYHLFCDTRQLWRIPNFADTISNLPFILVGIAGIRLLRRIRLPAPLYYSYACLFAGIVLTGIGSAYYHLNPSNDTLVFDRLPITIVFMSLLSAVAGESIGPRIAAISLLPFLFAGIVSIWWWQYTAARGHNDLRPYVLVQYYPILLIPSILLLFPTPGGKRGWPPLLFAIGWYAFAKLLEQLDCPIYSTRGFVSGHTLKHLAAAVSTWLLIKRFQKVHSPNLPDNSALKNARPKS